MEASVSHSGNHICFRFASGLAFLLFATCCAVGQIHETNVYSGINRLLPDGNDVGIEDHRTNTSQIGELTQVRVSLKITGNYNGDVYAYLRHTSPASTNSHIAVLLNRPGRTDANAYGYPDSGFDIVLDDLATNDVHTYQSVLTPPSGTPLTGEWQPDARLTDPYLVTTTSTRWAFLSTLKGMTGAGEWMLFVADMDAGGTNLLVSWSLELTGKMLPDVTWLSPGAIVYGSPLTTNELSASANVSGTFAYSPPLGTVLNAGTGQTLSVIFTPDDTNQYSTASAAVPIDVQPRQLVVTALDTNKTYGVSLQIDSTQFEAQGLLGGENITNLTLSCDGLDAVASVGTYPIVPSNAEGNFNITNYSPIYQPGTLSVDPASLTCQVVDATRFYGQANPAFGATYSGFLNSDDAGSLEGSLAFDTVAVTNSPVGTYVVTASGLAATNYSIVFVDGSLAVQPAPLLIIAQNATRLYGQTNPPFAATYSGLANGETPSVLEGTLALDCPATTNSPVGLYDISPSGLSATNYLVTFSNGVLTVSAFTLTVQVDSFSRFYGETNPVLTGSVQGQQNGDDISATFSTLADVSSPVGSYSIDVDLLDPGLKLANYQIVTNSGTLSVNPASLTCQAVDASRFYGQTNPAFTATYTGFLNSDNAGSLDGSLAFDTAATTNSAVGTYVVTASGLAATNYSIVFVDGSLAVQPAPLLIIAQEATRFYGQTNPPFAAIYSGLVNGETASVLDGTLIFDCQATTNSPVGPYDISPSGLTATNYLVAFSNAVLTINSSPSYCSLSSSTNMAAPGDSIVFTVSLSLEPPSELVPEGEVSFQIDGLDYGGPVTLDQGQGQLTATIAAPGLHTVTVAYVGDTNILGSTNALSPPQLVDTAPIATNLTMVRTVSGDSRIGINYLATNSQAADGGALTVQNVNPVTANGGTVMMTNGWIVYTPPDGNTNQDAFTFTVEDAFGVTSTGAITVNATPDVSAAARLKITAITNEICSLEIEGTPWGVYSLEAREDSFTTGGWHSLGIFTLDSTGWTTWLDSQSPVSPVKLYRVKFLDGIAVSTDISPLITDVSASTYSAPPGTTIDFDLKLTPSIANSPLPQGTLQCQVDGTNIGNLFALNNGEGLFSTAAIPWGQHVVSFVYGGDTSFPGFDVSLGKSVLIDSAPVAAPYNLTGSTSRGIKMLVSDLQTVASDPDGDPITIGLPSQTTAEGGSILMSDGWFYYTPPSGQLRQDGFNYLMRDSLGVTNFGAVNISPVAISDNFPAIQIIELATNTYRLQFSGVPWLGYTFQYASDSDGTNWLDLALCYADSQGLVTYDTTIPAGNGSILFRAVADDLGTSASPFQLDCWNNFVTITNNREMKVWSIRDLPTGWPDVPPVLAWNANCLIYGIKGFTGISPCNEFEVNLGQIPATLVTRRHAVVRGHSFGPNGLRTTNAPIGQRVWFLTASNAVVEMTIAACLVRSDFYNGQYYDYGLLIFTEDVPADIQPLSVMYLSDFGLYCYPNANVPYLVFGTEQGGNVGTEGDPVEPFVTNLWKGGDSGSPDFIISPDNKLVLISNRGGTGVSQQFAEDVDTLTLWAGLNPADYQLNWYDLSPWAP